MVHLVVPRRSLLGLECEGFVVGTEDQTQRLDPGEVSSPARGSKTNEACVDLEVSVRDECEMLIAFAVKVEDDAVATYESWV